MQAGTPVPVQVGHFDISVIIPWLSVLSVALTILAWYVRMQLREGIQKGYEKMEEHFASKEHLSYVEGMLKQQIESKFDTLARELRHISGALRELKDELRQTRERDRERDRDKPPTKF